VFSFKLDKDIAEINVDAEAEYIAKFIEERLSPLLLKVVL
jgi:hypothetical protein